MIELTLPWPPRELSPNARVHWRVRHKHSKAYRQLCGVLAIQHKRNLPEGRLHFVVIFCPPDRRHYDDDNLLARFKAGRDGIADGLGVNDKNFVTTLSIGDATRGGLVLVRIHQVGEQAK